MKDEALKLAEKLKHWSGNRDELWDAEAMIRRLVEELDKQTYKADLLENRLRILVGDKQSKPVAWMYSMALHPLKKGFSEVKPDDKYKPVPLYTAPQTKPLTNDEIMQVAENPSLWTDDGFLRSCIDFARAIEERHGIK